MDPERSTLSERSLGRIDLATLGDALLARGRGAGPALSEPRETLRRPDARPRRGQSGRGVVRVRCGRGSARRCGGRVNPGPDEARTHACWSSCSNDGAARERMEGLARETARPWVTASPRNDLVQRSARDRATLESEHARAGRRGEGIRERSSRTDIDRVPSLWPSHHLPRCLLRLAPVTAPGFLSVVSTCVQRGEAPSRNPRAGAALPFVPGGTFEVVVVDEWVKDRTADVARTAGLRCRSAKSGNRGKGYSATEC